MGVKIIITHHKHHHQHQHLPDVQPRRDWHEPHDAKNYARLDDAVLKIRVLRPKLKVLFKRLNHDCHHHVDDQEHDEEDEEVVPHVRGVGVDEELVVKVAGAEESACGGGSGGRVRWEAGGSWARFTQLQ